MHFRKFSLSSITHPHHERSTTERERERSNSVPSTTSTDGAARYTPTAPRYFSSPFKGWGKDLLGARLSMDEEYNFPGTNPQRGWHNFTDCSPKSWNGGAGGS